MKNLLIAGTVFWMFAVSGVEIIKKQAPVAKIYMDEKAVIKKDFHLLSTDEQKKQVLSMAVDDLNYHLRKMSGTELEVVLTADPSKVRKPGIVIGELANRFGVRPVGHSELDETFRVRADRDFLLIGGESPAAAAYGIYEVLERLGCDWVMPGVNGEVIPQRESVVIDDMDVEQSPSFAVRAPWYTGGSRIVEKVFMDEFDQWKLRHKEQLTRRWSPQVMIGGHVWDLVINKYREKFDAHPEMLALIRQPDGSFKRQGPQLESTHPDIPPLFADYIRSIFQKNGWPKDKAVCLGVGPADGVHFSRSAESMLAGTDRINPVSGDPDITDLQILLCNQLIEILEKEFPNLTLGFYLYAAHAEYPIRYIPHPKVTIVIADIAYSRFHSIIDPNSKTRHHYRQIVDQWGELHRKQGNYLFFRGYNWNLADNFLPYTKIKIWAEDLPYYHRLGVSGVYNECIKAWSVLAPSEYLEAKLTWNVNRDWKEVLKQYCRSAFGGGAPALEQYYLKLAERQSKAGYEAGSYHSFALMYDRKFVADCRALFEKAETAAETPMRKQRVRFARIPLNMLSLFLDYRAAYCSFDFQTAEKKYEGMLGELRRYEKIDGNLVCRSASIYLKRFYGDFVKQSVKYSSGEYRMVFPLPEHLKATFDSDNCGQSLGLYKKALNDRDYLTLSTYSTTWDAQGLMGFRGGSVWYRVDFDLTETLAGKPLGLFVGGSDSVVRVWCNEQYIGMGRRFAKPFTFDLTDAASPGKNQLTIQVQQYGSSEIGTGGLIYPSFIFTGPRLAQRTTHTETGERLLPGGEVAPH